MTATPNPAASTGRAGQQHHQPAPGRRFAIGDHVRVRVDSRIRTGRVGVIERANPYGAAEPLGVWYVRFAATARAAECVVCLAGWQLLHHTAPRDDA